MCRVLLPLLLLTAVIAEKESVSEEHIGKITDKLVRVLEKRLNEWGLDENDGLSEEDDQCAFIYNNGSIIRTQDSINAGATFIKSPQVEARESCEEICCDIANCNLAVYKDKVNENSCYLFDCGAPSICLFTLHPGFVSMEIPKRQNPSHKHEAALEELAAPTTMSSTTSTTTTTTTTAAPTTTTTTTTTEPPPPQHVQPVPLFGECDSHKDCAGSATECLAGYCVCQEGYLAQDGTCHSTKDMKEEVEEKENEEEENEEEEEVTAPVSMEQQVSDQSQKTSEEEETAKQSPEIDTTAVTVSNAERAHVAAGSVPSSLPSSTEKPDTEPAQESEPAEEDDRPEEQQQSHSTDDNGDIIIEDSEADNTGVVSQVTKDTANTLEEEDNDNEDDDDDDDDDDDEDVDAAEVVEADAVFVGTTTMHQNQSAVIALALGLGLTVLLLVFVGCRLRNMKRRLRKGRPLNSNEADYLINGMYL